MSSNGHLSLISNNVKEVSNTTQSMKTIADDLIYIRNLFIGIKLKNIVIGLCLLFTGAFIESHINLFSRYMSTEKDIYTRTNPLLIECESDVTGNCLLRMQTENGFYQAEIIEEFLVSGKEEQVNLATSQPSIIDRAALYEKKILRNTEFSSGKIQESKNSLQQSIILEGNPSNLQTEKMSIVSVEFVSDEIFDEKEAAACVNGIFFGKQVELKNPSNLENNTVVNVKNSLNCEPQTGTVVINKCGAVPRVQIPFSEARKLFPLSYNPDENINNLASCRVAQVQIIPNN